jgi:hypothetical protein
MQFVVRALVGGVLIVVPVYLSVLLLLKAMQSVGRLVRPFAMLLPEWLPSENALSLLLVLIVCFLIGAAVRTRAGRATRERMERSLFERMPGYALLRSLTQQLTGAVRRRCGSRPSPRWEKASFPHLSSKNSGTDCSQSSCPRCPRQSRGPSISSRGTGCIRWTCRSRRQSRPSPDGDRAPGSSSRR